MKILVDCSQIGRAKAGVGVYALGLLAELCRTDGGNHFTLLAQDDDPDMDFGRFPNVTMIWVNAKVFRKLPLRFLLEQLFIPLLALRHRIDVVHSLHYSFPLAPMRAKKVVTIHDMTSFQMPEVHIPIKRRYFHVSIRAAARWADALIFVSRSSQNDFLKYFPRDPASCHVVALGKSDEFRRDLDPQQVSRVVRNLGLATPYILFIGMIEPRKNLDRLVRAFSAVAAKFPSHTLVIAGSKGWRYQGLFDLVRSLGLEKRVVFTGFVAEQDKPYLIRGAQVFVYPSLYEGFGIPVLEALACGTPTLTSNVSSIPEITGDAALLVDPANDQEIADGLERLLRDASLRAALADRSIQRSALFSWTITAAETLEVYRKAAGR